MTPGDAEYGCSAFGHLTSPFVDGELPRGDMESLAIHLDACRPCQQLVASYRALDVVARRPCPSVSDADWARAWGGVQAAIAADREAAAHGPLASVARIGARIGTRLGGGRRRPWLRPLGYAAAAGLLVALTLSLQRRWDEPGPADRPDVTAARPPRPAVATTRDGTSPAASAPMSIACLEPDFMAVVYTIDGENPMTVVQCTFVGAEPGPARPGKG